MSDLSNPTAEPVEQAERVDQTALRCYLSTVVALGNCMAEVCPPVGKMYRERLLKLPRRLAFDATPRALEQSRQALETDLQEYARTAGEWMQAGSNHATMLMNHLRETEETLAASADLQSAFLDDLAEHIETTAEVDDDSQLRTSFKRYAAGLSAYARKTRTEKLSAVEDLRRRRGEIEAWLAEATASTFIDPETGLLNRVAAEMRIETEISKEKTFCMIVVGRTEDTPAQSLKDLADQLAAAIRPYDMIFRWSQDQLVTIFEASRADVAARVQQIAGWLGRSNTTDPKSRIEVFVVEHLAEEAAKQLIARIEAASKQEVVTK